MRTLLPTCAGVLMRVYVKLINITAKACAVHSMLSFLQPRQKMLKNHISIGVLPKPKLDHQQMICHEANRAVLVVSTQMYGICRMHSAYMHYILRT